MPRTSTLQQLLSPPEYRYGQACFPRAAEGIWREVIPGLLIKTLYVDRLSGGITGLARMAEGSCDLPHRDALHPGPLLFLP